MVDDELPIHSSTNSGSCFWIEKEGSAHIKRDSNRLAQCGRGIRPDAGCKYMAASANMQVSLRPDRFEAFGSALNHICRGHMTG